MSYKLKKIGRFPQNLYVSRVLSRRPTDGLSTTDIKISTNMAAAKRKAGKTQLMCVLLKVITVYNYLNT